MANRLIGVEVTKYNGGPNSEDLEKEISYWRLSGRLYSLMKGSADMRGVRVTLYAPEKSNISKNKLPQITQSIFNLIESKLAEINERDSDLRLTPQLEKSMRAIKVSRMVGELSDIHFPVQHDLQAAWVGIPQEALINIIRKKNSQQRTEGHDGQKFDECWLLITDGPGLRGGLNSPKEGEFYEFADLWRALKGSAFSRCYLLCDDSAVFEVTAEGVRQRALYHEL